MSDHPQLLILRAAQLAAELHQDQRRKGASKRPYINHPLEVAQRLAEGAQVTDAEVLAAALLHDTVEDTDATAEDILEAFGPRVAALVAEVTDDKSLEKAERKQLQVEHAPHLSADAAAIKISDKTSNVMDLVRDPPPDWSHSRLVGYLDWAERVVGAIKHPHPALRQRFHAAIAAGRAALVGGDGD
jgi:guanosine-3',5'-bis(diphosphate) 3'-pyrophosphohydrolase